MTSVLTMGYFYLRIFANRGSIPSVDVVNKGFSPFLTIIEYFHRELR